MAQLSDNRGRINHQATGDSEAKEQSSSLPGHLLRQWPCILLLLIALAFNLYRLGTPSIWFDEAFSVELARQPLPLLWHIIFGLEPNMELYYLFLHAWLGLTAQLGLAPTEGVVRFPSAIFAALSTVVVYLLGRRYITPLAGAIGAVLYLLNDLQLIYAQQTRAYSLQLLFICCAWYALLAALTSATHARRWWVCYVLAMTLAIYTHLFSLFILLAQFVATVGILLLPTPWRTRARTQWRALLVSLVLTGVLIIPMLLMMRVGAKTGWLPVPRLADLTALVLTLSGDKRLYLIIIVVVFITSISIVGLSYLLSLRKDGANTPAPGGVSATSVIDDHDAASDSARSQQGIKSHFTHMHAFFPITWILLCWQVLPIVLSYGISQGSLRLFSSRYLVTIVPPLFLLIALCIALMPRRILRVVVSTGLILSALYAVPFYYQHAQVEDWNATHWLQQRYQAGDGLVCYDNSVQQGCQIAVEYYLHAYPGAAHFTSDTPGRFSWESFGLADPMQGPDAAVDPRQLAIFAGNHARVFFIVGRVRDASAASRALAARQWLDSHYHRISQLEGQTVSIYLYATQ